jgi:hypothetical protein
VWLANCYFAQDSSGLPVLLRFCNAQSGRSVHPFVERLIGTIRREYLDHTLFWTMTDLENKLLDFRAYFNNHRTHNSPGRPNARYAAVTTSRKSPIVSMATTVSGPLSDTGGCLISKRFVLAAVSARPLQKPRMKSSGVRVLSCSAFRGSDRFTAAVSIRQRLG